MKKELIHDGIESVVLVSPRIILLLFTIFALSGTTEFGVLLGLAERDTGAALGAFDALSLRRALLSDGVYAADVLCAVDARYPQFQRLRTLHRARKRFFLHLPQLNTLLLMNFQRSLAEALTANEANARLRPS